jgi:hypothetical protein
VRPNRAGAPVLSAHPLTGYNSRAAWFCATHMHMRHYDGRLTCTCSSRFPSRLPCYRSSQCPCALRARLGVHINPMGALIAATIPGNNARRALTVMTIAPAILGTAGQRTHDVVSVISCRLVQPRRTLSDVSARMLRGRQKTRQRPDRGGHSMIERFDVAAAVGVATGITLPLWDWLLAVWVWLCCT